MSKKPYYEQDGFKLIKGDSFKELKRIELNYKGLKRILLESALNCTLYFFIQLQLNMT